MICGPGDREDGEEVTRAAGRVVMGCAVNATHTRTHRRAHMCARAHRRAHTHLHVDVQGHAEAESEEFEH